MEDSNLPPPRVVYRTMGTGPSWQRIGCGVMDKSGIANDQRDFRQRTWSLIYVLRGIGVYTDHLGRRWPLAPGWCFVRVPSLPHTTTLDPASRWLEAFVDIGTSLYEPLASMQVLRAEPPVWSWGLSPNRVARFTALIADLARAAESDLPALSLRVAGLAVDAQDQHGSGNAPGASAGDGIDRACRLLADESTRRIDLRAFCRRERLDYERFRKEFLRRTGAPPGQYRIRRRMDRACQLLQTTERSIAEIAVELGYPSPYEFSAQFKQRMGVPPSRYRGR